MNLLLFCLFRNAFALIGGDPFWIPETGIARGTRPFGVFAWRRGTRHGDGSVVRRRPILRKPLGQKGGAVRRARPPRAEIAVLAEHRGDDEGGSAKREKDRTDQPAQGSCLTFDRRGESPLLF